MSVRVNFHTAKQFEPKIIFDELVKRGKSIIVTSAEFPCLKLGTHLEALRGIEINQEENGYEVRVCSFANRSDLQLYAAVVEMMMSLTGEKPLYENDEEEIISNPKEFLGDEWIRKQLDESLTVCCALIKYHGKPIIMDGLFFPFCFGPILAREFDIELADPYPGHITDVQDYLAELQWKYADKESTSTRLAIQNPNDEERPLSMSLIYAEDGKVKPFDYVSYADVLCLMDKDKEVVMIRMEDFWKITSSDKFTLMDDYQVAIKGELTYESFLEMQKKAKLFQVEDLSYHPTFPGNGYDEKQKTYVLMWNPAISSVKMEDHVDSIPNLLTEHYNWSVYEYQEAKKDDRFVLIRCGEGKTGLVMSGVFDSNPYQAEDWSGKGRKVFYMDMTPNFIVDPDNGEIITTKELQEAIPSFDWSGGHSGRLLTEEQARQLENLLAPYLAKFNNNLDEETVNGFSLPQNDDY